MFENNDKNMVNLNLLISNKKELSNSNIEQNEKNIKDNLINETKKDFPIQKLFSFRRPFSKLKRKIIFIFIFITNIFINIDHGAIPAGTTVLKKENNLDNVQIGIIGSLVYLGLVLGSISAGPIFSSYSSKWVVILSLLITCFFLYLFTIFTSGWGMAICRTCCGFGEVFCYIYFPVWIDQYGADNQKTIWLTFHQLGVPIGTMLGYVMEALYIKKYNRWKYAFYTQILLIISTIVIFILTPDKFFSRNFRRSETPQNEIEKEVQYMKNIFENESNLYGNDKYRDRNFHFMNAIINNKFGRTSQYSIFSMIDETETEGGISKYLTVLKELIYNKKYIYTMFGISCLLFVVTGIQFWITDYMQEVMNISPSSAYIIFSVVCITGPVLGVLLGGFFIQYLGGYTDKRALVACFKIAGLAACCGIILPILNIVWLFVILMWLLLFFGGSVTPGLTGIMLSSIPENSKEIGNSLTQLCYNLIGYLPSPFLYGLVCKYTGGSKSRFGLAFLLLWAFIGVLSLYFAKKAQNAELDDNTEILLDEGNSNMKNKSEIIINLFGRLSIN